MPAAFFLPFTFQHKWVNVWEAGSGSGAAGLKGKQVKDLYELVTVSGECEI
jgi:hypothetical protein